MPLDPILYINSVNVYGWLVYIRLLRCECVKLLRCKLSVYCEDVCDLPYCFDQGCYSSLVAVATSNTAVLSGPTCLFKFQDILKTCVS